MTVYFAPCVTGYPEGIHDLSQAVLSCHKVFHPFLHFPSLYSCPSLPSPSPLAFWVPFIATLLELYLPLSFSVWVIPPPIFPVFSSLSVCHHFPLIASLLFLSASICWKDWAFFFFQSNLGSSDFFIMIKTGTLPHMAGMLCGWNSCSMCATLLLCVGKQ